MASGEMEARTCPTRIVKLNIGGYKFVTTEAVLCRQHNFFSGLLGGKVPALFDEKGFYFLDRDGQYFAVLLEYLRTGDWVVPAPLCLASVLREADFYLIDVPERVKRVREVARLGDEEAEGEGAQLRTDGVYVLADRRKFMWFTTGGLVITHSGNYPYTFTDDGIVCFHRQSQLLDTFSRAFKRFCDPSRGLCFRGDGIAMTLDDSLTEVIFGTDCVYGRLNTNRTQKGRSLACVNCVWKSDFEFRGSSAANSPRSLIVNLDLVILTPYLLIRESGKKWCLWTEVPIGELALDIR